MSPPRSDPGQQLRSVALRYGLPQRWQSARGVTWASWLGGNTESRTGFATDAVATLEHQTASAAAEDRPLGRDADLARLEAVLLLAREPLNSRKLAHHANLADGTLARTLIRRLNERYDAAERAFRVEQVAGGFQLRSRAKFAPWLRRLAHVPGESRLSAPALETLSVIAYRQPVPRADIEAVRGVNCGEILRQLMDRDLVRVSGRGEDLGRPFLYATTPRFLELFGLMHLDDLPRHELLRHAPLPRAGPGVTILAETETDPPSTSATAVDEAAPEPDTSDENPNDFDLNSPDLTSPDLTRIADE